jgi:Ubiquitin-2 like Rad60 SUMO-like
MEEIFEFYAQRKGVALENCRFLSGGEVIEPNHTPFSLEIYDHDMIDVWNIHLAEAHEF